MDKEALQTTITLLGVFFLGGFVGFLLSLAINFSLNVNLKVISALIGAALGGAPVLFMQGLGFEKWMYPIGLVIGFLWIRVVRAREIKSPNSPRLALIDTIFILLFTFVVILCATFATSGVWQRVQELIGVPIN